MTQVLPLRSHGKTAAFIAGAVTAGVCASLIAAELLLRAAGITPWSDSVDDAKGAQALYEPDPALGWRNRPVAITVPSGSGGEPFRWTFLADGRRSTGPEGPLGCPVVVLVGCSFTQGIGLSDHETYAWNLQLRNPEIAIRNYGTGGYGTYQSLLVLETLFASAQSPRPELVLYGFIEHHEIRNVAAPDWTRLLALSSSRGRVDLPYCSIDADGSLRRHDPEHYPVFSLMRYSSVANKVQQASMALVASARNAQRRRVTERLLTQMDRLCRSNGTAFAVLLLHASRDSATHYLGYCRGEGIECHDVLSPMTADLRLPGDNHPNAKQNQIWAERIDHLIGRKLRLAQAGHRRMPPEDAARVASGRESRVVPGTRR
jgi:hypothetical protein